MLALNGNYLDFIACNNGVCGSGQAFDFKKNNVLNKLSGNMNKGSSPSFGTSGDLP